MDWIGGFLGTGGWGWFGLIGYLGVVFMWLCGVEGSDG